MIKPHYQTLEFQRVDKIIRELTLQSSTPLRILDFGCGPGKYATHFTSLGCHVTAVDANPSYVEKLCANGIECMAPDVFMAGEQGEFDVIFLSHLIEHIPPDELTALIPRLCRALSSSGRLVLITPLPGERFYHDFSHVRPYLPQSIRHAFGQLGAPISYGESRLIQMIDIHFFKDPYRTRTWRSFYTGPVWMQRVTRCINRMFDMAWLASGGRIGATASWLGIYQLADTD